MWNFSANSALYFSNSTSVPALDVPRAWETDVNILLHYIIITILYYYIIITILHYIIITTLYYNIIITTL